jgi:hypothetical protein
MLCVRCAEGVVRQDPVRHRRIVHRFAQVLHRGAAVKTYLCLTALLLASCAAVTPAPQSSSSSIISSATGVRFGAERVSREVIRLSLDNGAQQPIGYNLCNSELQRHSDSEWVSVPSDDLCTMQLMTLNSGHDATFEKRLPASHPTDEYRYVTRIESPIGNEPVLVATDPFTLP